MFAMLTQDRGQESDLRRISRRLPFYGGQPPAQGPVTGGPDAFRHQKLCIAGTRLEMLIRRRLVAC